MPDFFVNPYNFVRAKLCAQKNKKRPTNMHELFSGFSGTISCSLQAKTRIFIPYNQDFASEIFGRDQIGIKYEHEKTKEEKYHLIKYQMCDYNKKPIIQSSSLKGVIRAVAEAISNSCGYPPGNKCSNANSLCICCRIFGMVMGSENFQGKVSISDATTDEDDALENSNEGVILKILGTPIPTHTPFYKKQNQKRGRKFYYHQTDEQAEANLEILEKAKIWKQLRKRMERTILKSWIRANSHFSFSVDFFNLEEEELGLLLYALELEDILVDDHKVGMYHKIGMAKPLGFGSCEIKINDLRLLADPQTRYSSLNSGFIESNDQIRDFEEYFFHDYYRVNWQDKNNLENITDLRRIMSYNGYQNSNIHYPSTNWFKVTNASTSLPTVEEVSANLNMLPE